MKAIITQKTDINSDLTRAYTFDVLDDDNTVILSSQSVVCRPSQVQLLISDRVKVIRAEYEAENDIEVGSEVI